MGEMRFADRRTQGTMDDGAAWCDGEEGFRCRRHPSWRRNGVCVYCLRDRLLRLCPDCARARPCTCSVPPPPPSSSFSASSSSSSFSSSDFAPPLPPLHRGIGAVGRVSELIETEPAFQRSRSAAFSFLRVGDRAPAPPRRGFWWFTKMGSEKRKDNAAAASEVRFSRSRSVGVERLPATDRGRRGGGGGGRREEKAKNWGWHFPSPMKAFVIKHRKSSAVARDRSPICRA